MPRSVAEWIATNDDATIPPRVRLRVFDRFGGVCQCGCTRKITAGEAWECDHIIALINGGEHREGNMHPLITEHHKAKTREDVAEKSRTYQRRTRHLGIAKKKHRWGYGKGEPFKMKIGGGVVKR